MPFKRELPRVVSPPTQIATLNDFSGGLNNRDAVIKLRDNESPDLMNVDFSEAGSVSKRNGTSLVGNDVGNAKILGLYSFVYGQDSAQQVMVTNVGVYPPSLYYRTTGNWTEVNVSAFANADVEFDKFLGDSATEFVFFTDGTTLRTYNPATNAVATAGASPATTGGIIRVYQNKLYLRGSATKPERVYFSALGNGESWSANDYFDVPSQATGETGATGDPITAFAVHQNRLIIFKRYSTWAWDTSRLVQIHKTIGCVGKRAFCTVGNYLYFMSYDGVQRLSGNFIEPVSLKIKSTIDAIPDARKPEIAMEFFDDKVFVATAASGAANNNIVLVNYPFLRVDELRQAPWSYWKGGSNEMAFSVFSVYQQDSTTDPILTGGRASADSVVIKLDTGTSDYPSTAAITSYYKTKYFPIVARYKKAHIFMKAQTVSSNLTFRWQIDFGESGGATTFDQKSSGTDVYGTGIYGTATYGGETALEGRYMVAESGKFIQYEFRNDQADEPYTVYELKQQYKPKKLR